MKLFFLALGCLCLAAAATNEDAWNEAVSDATPTELLEDPVPGADFEQEFLFTEIAPGGQTERTPFGDSTARKQYITHYLNRVYRDLCKLPPLKELTVQSVTSQVVAGTEYTVKAAVDGKPTTIVFQRLPGNKQHPGKSPNINDNGNLRDLFHVVSIVPHPCDSYVAAELVDKEPATPYTYGLQMPAVMHYTKSLISEEERAEIPSDFDWRDHITGGHTAKAAQVQNQGSCGSCWAFAASTVLSYGLNIKSEGRYDVQPSPQIGMSCANDKPCGGGWMKSMYQAAFDKGLPPAWAVPYTAKKGPCTESPKSIEYFAAKTPLVDCKDTAEQSSCDYWIQHQTCAHGGVRNACLKSCGCPGRIETSYKGESDMVAEIYKNGPSAGVLAAVGGWGSYKSGVYSPTASENKSPTNHAITIVGFGTQSGKKYWLIQNSWGAGWGDGGFIKLERGVDALSIEKSGMSSGYVDVTSKRVKCQTAAVCKNGGAYKEDCTCRCAAGFTGADCAGCDKSCPGAQFAGSASAYAGKCQCKCAAGFHNMHNLKGYGDCAVKFHFNGFTGSTAKLSFAVSGTAPRDKIQNVKKGDIVVAVAPGQKPWSAATGWNTEIMANVCGAKAWPAQVCGDSSISISFPNGASGDYDLYYLKYNGKSEFGTDKGYGSDFLFLQTISSDTVAKPTPVPTPATPSPTPAAPTKYPTRAPTEKPTRLTRRRRYTAPTRQPTEPPTKGSAPGPSPPSPKPATPTKRPTRVPTERPTRLTRRRRYTAPTRQPTEPPTRQPTEPPTKGSAPGPSPPSPKPDATCKDKKKARYCAYMSKKGYCEKTNSYSGMMARYCANTCNLCDVMMCGNEIC